MIKIQQKLSPIFKKYSLFSILLILMICISFKSNSQIIKEHYFADSSTFSSIVKILKSSDGSGYFLIGYGSDNSSEINNVNIKKINNNFDLVWNKYINFDQSVVINNASYNIDSSKIFVAGEYKAYDINFGFIDCIDTNGILLKTYNIGSQNKAYFFKNIEYSLLSNQLFVCGTVKDTSGGIGNNIVLFCFDTNLKLLWQRETGTEYNDKGQSIITDLDSNIVIVGDVASNKFINDNVYTIGAYKFDSKGNLLYKYIANNNGYSMGPQKIIQDSEGNYIIVGESPPKGGGSFDIIFIKLDKELKELKKIIYGGDGVDAAFSISEIKGIGYALSGYSSTKAILDNARDIFISILNYEVKEIYRNNLGKIGTNTGLDIFIVAKDTLMICGNSSQGESLNQYIALFSLPINLGIESEYMNLQNDWIEKKTFGNIDQLKYSLLQNYKNIYVEVYNILGEQVYTNQNINSLDLNSGIYMIWSNFKYDFKPILIILN